MPQIHSYTVNDTVYKLPSMNQFSSQLQDLAQAMSFTGVTAYEMIQAIKMVNEVLSSLEYHNSEITAIKDDLHDLRYETEGIQRGLDCRTAVLEMEISDLRSVLDEKTETPNQKSDLEIFPQIELDSDFLKFFDIDTRLDLALKEGNIFLN